MPQPSFRRDWITKPIFRMAARALPRLSDTEREAIEAGDVWWDADLFTGNPDWNKLLAFAPARLAEEEQQFLAGPVEELCRMLDEWQITWELHDLPPAVVGFPRQAKKFFAMIIPKQYGGLGFSAFAHFGSHPQIVVALDLWRRDRDGPQLARPGRTAHAVRHRGAAQSLAAAARQRRGDSVLRPHQPGGGLRRRLDDR